MKRRRIVIVRLMIVVLLVAASWHLARNHYVAEAQSTMWFGTDGAAELAPILQMYGPRRYSRNVEEWLIRDYFQDRREGIFLDVGANHYEKESNTYFLEKELGWSGIAIDALEEFADDYRIHRPRTKFFALFVSDVAESTAQLFVPESNKLVASVSREFTEREGTPGNGRQVPTSTLNQILKQANVSRLDFVSMDIELSEPKALAGFDIDRFRPSLVCIEAHPDVRQQILDYFTAHRYTIVGKYLRADPKNLYFHPLK